MKEAFYLVHHDVEPSLVAEWNAFHATDHVPRVVKSAGFHSAQRYRHLAADGTPADPPRFTTVYRAAGLGQIRAYLEGGEVGKMRAHHDAFVAGRRIHLTREIFEENYSVDGEGKPAADAASLPTGRAAFVVRARVDTEAVGPWSAWYDREHMPAVARTGFLRAGRYKVVEDAAGQPRFAMIYEAPSVEAVVAFRSGAGPAFGKEHEKAFGSHVTIDRLVWSLAN